MPPDRDSDRQFGKMARVRLGALSLALGASLATFMLCANSSIARAGDDDGDESLVSKFMHTLGLKSPNDPGPDISYSERSPLVVPPTRDLPVPSASAGPPAPNWPKDPDVRARAAAKAKKKEIHPADWFAESLPLRPDEIDRGRTTSRDDGRMASSAGSSGDSQSSVYELSGKKSIFNLNWFSKEEYGTFTGEPARASLTDPPVGYLTPSPDQPYGIGPDGKKATNKNIGDRMNESNGH
jgi:hypothetical protein